jgi:serine/threonine protein kinase
MELSVAPHRCDVCGAQMAPSTRIPQLDELFALEPGPVLGQGSFATVHAGRRLSDDSPCAIKLLDLRRAADSSRVRKQLRASFLREARALMVLDHPNVVRVVSFGMRDTDTLFMAMDKLPRESTLARVLRRAQHKGRRPGVNTTLRVLEEVGSALRYVHARGIVHRDIKPGNIGIDVDRRFRVLDFGLLKNIDDEWGESEPQTFTVAGWGSFNYGAPEQFLNGRIGPWTDLYSLGATAYEMVTGRPPIVDGTLEQILASMSSRPPPLPPSPERPEALDALIMRLVEKSPEDRFFSAEAMLQAVARVRKDVRRATTTRISMPDFDPMAHESGTPVPRVQVIRERQGDETRKADIHAIARALAAARDIVDTGAPSASDRSGLGLTPEPSMPGSGAALPVGGAPPDWTVPLVASVTLLLGLLGLAAMLLPA